MDKDTRIIKIILDANQATQTRKKYDEQRIKAHQNYLDALRRGDQEGMRRAKAEEARARQALDRMMSRTQIIDRALRNLDKATPKELKKVIKEINDALNSGNVERNSQEWQELTAKLRDARQELRLINNESRAAAANPPSPDDNVLAQFGTRWVGLATIVRGAVSDIMGAFNSMNRYVTEYADMAEHMAGVSKYTGMTAKEVDELNEAFRQMDTRTSREALNDLAADAGRLGIQGKQQVLDFVEAADILNVALGEDLGEGAVKNIGKLAQLFGDADRMGLKQAMLATGSVINELAQSSSADEGYIMDFTARLAGMARQAGMTQAQVMGLASVMDQAMVNAEEGSTALSRLIQVLYKEPARLAVAVGLDVQQFTALVKQDANAALLEFARAAEQLGGMDRLAPILGDLQLTGAGVTKVITSLANNIQLVKTTQEQATRAFSEATSVQREFDAANNTLQARLEKNQARLREVALTLGKELLPIVDTGTRGLTAFLQGLTATATWLKNNWKALVALSSAIGLYEIAVHYATIKETLHTKAITAKNLAMATGSRIITTLRAAQIKLNAAMRAHPYAAIVTAVMAICAGIALWLNRTRELTQAQREQQAIDKDNIEIQQAGAKATAATENRIRLLTAIVHDNTRSLSERRSAIKALQRLSPDYRAEISAEGKVTNENTKALKDYIEQLRKAAIEKAAIAKTESLTGSLLEYEESKGRRRNAVSIRRKRLQDFIEANQKQLGIYTMEYLTNRSTSELKTGAMLNFGKIGKVYELAYSLREAEGWVDDINGKIGTTQKRIAAVTNTAKKMGATFTQAISGDTGEAPGKGNTPPAPTPTGGKDTDPAEALKKQTRIARLQLDIQREQGILSLSDYNEKAYNLQRTHLRALRDLYKEGTEERLEADKELAQLERRHREEQNAWSMADVDRQEKEEAENIRQNYLHGLISHEQYERAKTETTLRYIAKRISLQREAGNEEEANRLQATYDELSQQDQLKRQEEFWQRVETLQKEHLKKSAEEQMQTELDLAQQMHTTGLLNEEQYQQALASIRKKYARGGEGSDTAIGGSADPISSALVNTFRIFEQLDQRVRDGQATWQDYAAAGVASLQVVTATLQSATALVQANMQAETAAINQRYDREIQRAGANTRRGKKLEEKRQRELAAVKTKYNKKQMAMEMAQAVSMTAIAAINAYASASKVNFILGPIAAAAALAAGAIQIAAIKKQHEAQEQGYYSGGFTGGRDYRRKAGIVHEGEFVANHQAVANPAVLPLLQLIDHAQRTNRIASLTAEDVSQAIAAPARTAAHAEQTTQAARTIAGAATTGAGAVVKVVSEPQTEQLEVLNRLAEQLDKGVTAVVAIDGPQGFDQQWTRYNRLRGRKQS